jgi:PKD repeat protein
MRAILTVAALAVVALGGCVDEDTSDPGPLLSAEEDADPFNDGQEADVAHEEDAGDDEDNETANSAPSVQFTSNVTDGTAPLAVRFDLNASDADGDALAWSLDVDGDGTADLEGTDLPANFTFTFSAPGEFTARAAASDGTDETLETLVITVADAVVPDEPTGPVLQDRGWYEIDPATGICYVKNYTELVPGVLYNSPLSGGDWYILEDNDIPGLQIADNHPVGDPIGSGLDLPDCVDGDQVIL